MTIYDAAMVGVVVAGMVWGAWRGITWQVASIASLVLGYLFAHPVSAYVAPHLPGEPAVARALSMLVAYAIVSGGVFGVAWLIRATLRRLKFEAYDRHLGMVLGGLEGGLLGVVATVFVVGLAPQSREPIFASPSGKVVGKVMEAIGPVLPTEIRQAVAPYVHPGAAVAATATEARPADEAQAEPFVEPGPRPTKLIDRPSFRIGSIDRDDRALDAAPARTPRRDMRAARASAEVEAPAPTPSPSGDAPAADELSPAEVRARIGRAAGQTLQRRLVEEADAIKGLAPEDRARIGRAAGELLERGIKDGQAPDLDRVIKDGKSRLRQAAGDLLERELDRRLGETDGRTPERR